MTNTPRAATRRRSGDRGVAAVFFAIVVSAMLAVGALVLGGSIGYAAVRNAQTAADAAALAGASTLREHKADPLGADPDSPSAGDVLADVVAIVADNDSVLAPGGCELVTAQYAVANDPAEIVDDCAALGSLSNADFDTVAGVRVSVLDDRDVPFGSFVGKDTIAGSAVAAATIQPLREGTAPFLVCTAPTAVGHPAQALVPDASDSTGYSVNPAALGLSYVIWGNEMKNDGRDCGNGSSSWRGLTEFGGSYPMPSPAGDESQWWRIKTGNSGGHIPRLLAGENACDLVDDVIDDLVVGCRIALPLCPASNGSTGANFRLYCVKMGAFEIQWISKSTAGPPPCHPSPEGNSLICAKFLGAATATNGQGGASTPDPDSLVVIKLVE